MIRGFAKTGAVFVLLTLLPVVVYAQASITGTVRDASGGVLPGVTAEATSPALTEKVRTVVTDGSGQYRIVDLSPGTYTVTFTLPGFNTVKREGIELTGSFTASVSVEMRVGGVEETITVTGESPIVDVQSVRRQTTMTNEVLSSLPSARAYGAIMLLVPSMVTQGAAPAQVQVRPGMTVFGGAGGRNNEGRLQVNGLNVGASRNGGGVSGYNVDMTNATEVTFTTSGGLGEAEVGGPAIQIVPRTGSNEVRGAVYLSGLTEKMVSDNITAELQAAGLPASPKLLKVWDYTFGVGGPVMRDRLWYFGNIRFEGGETGTAPTVYANRNAGDPTKWLYDPDFSRPARSASSWTIANLRLTVQATQNNKFDVFWDEQIPCTGATFSSNVDGCRKNPDSEFIYGGGTFFGALLAPEADGYMNSYSRVQQASWSSTRTNRLLLEAGLGTYLSRWGTRTRPGSPVRDFVRVTEQCATTAGCLSNGGIPNLNYRSHNWLEDWIGQHNWRAAASYVTGAHSMKFGYMGGFFVDDEIHGTNNHNLQYRTQNGVPDQLTMDLTAHERKFRTRFDAFYAQEQWTMGRATVQGALRYDFSRSWFPEQQVGPTRFLPNPITFARTDGVKGWHDLSPRVGVAYDVFGTGKTSVKVNFGKYLEAASNDQGLYSQTNPTSRIAGSSALGALAITRTWTDLNANWVPDCNLLNPAANGGECGAINNSSFGTPTLSNNFNEDILEGWSRRPNDWQFGISVQQEVLPRVSVEAGYYRRWLKNFFVFDNLAQNASDFGQFSFVAPRDSRLPDETRGRTITGLYNANANVAATVQNRMTSTDDFGDASQRSHGLSLNVNARTRIGLLAQGGFNIGKSTGDVCDVRENLPEAATGALVPVLPNVGVTNPWCHTEVVQTRVTGLASYTVPKIDVLVSTTFRSEQGQVLTANYSVLSALAQQTLGRPLSLNSPFVVVPLIEPGELFGPRINQFDMKLAKVLRFGRTRTTVGVDVFNVGNVSTPLTHNMTFNPAVQSGPGAWLQPLTILTPRLVRVSGQFDF